MTRGRKVLLWVGAFVLLAVSLLSAAFVGAGHFLEGPAQDPVKADLLMALGGDSGARTNSVLWLYRKGFAPRILVGSEGAHSRTRPFYTNWRGRYLVSEGVPESALLYDLRSLNSWEEAVNTLQLMRSMNLDRVLVVSDPPHMRRLSWVWGRVFAGSGKSFTLVASEMDAWDPARWWNTSPNAQFVFSEYIKLAYYLYQY